MPQKLLITGASGFLGWHLCQEAVRQGWQVYGTYHQHPTQMAGTTLCKVDLTDLAAMKDAIAHIQPDAVIHAAAQARPNQCELEPELAYQINVTASLALAELCNQGLERKPVAGKAKVNNNENGKGSIPFVFISSNQVFDGTEAPYREDDPVSPINVYGEQKVAAEEGILARHTAPVICRMPLMFGVAPTALSFLQGFLQRLAVGEPLKLFTDEFRTPLSGTDAAKGILLALQAGKSRLHLGGAERLSRYEFGQILASVLGIDESNLMSCRQQDVPMAAARAPDLTMDCSQAQALGYAPTKVRSALMDLNIGVCN